MDVHRYCLYHHQLDNTYLVCIHNGPKINMRRYIGRDSILPLVLEKINSFIFLSSMNYDSLLTDSDDLVLIQINIRENMFENLCFQHFHEEIDLFVSIIRRECIRHRWYGNTIHVICYSWIRDRMCTYHLIQCCSLIVIFTSRIVSFDCFESTTSWNKTSILWIAFDEYFQCNRTSSHMLIDAHLSRLCISSWRTNEKNRSLYENEQSHTHSLICQHQSFSKFANPSNIHGSLDYNIFDDLN